MKKLINEINEIGSRFSFTDTEKSFERMKLEMDRCSSEDLGNLGQKVSRFVVFYGKPVHPDLLYSTFFVTLEISPYLTMGLIVCLLDRGILMLDGDGMLNPTYIALIEFSSYWDEVKKEWMLDD